MYSFSYLEPVCCSMSSSNCCFLTCIQIFQEEEQVVWYSHLFQNFPQFIVIHTVKGFGIVNKAEIDSLELSCFFHDPVDNWKSKRVPEKPLLVFIDYAKTFDCVDHNKLWKIFQEMEIPDHLICFLRSLYAGQEATVSTGHGTTDWFQIGKGVRQGCNCHPAYLTSMQNTSWEMLGWKKHKLESKLLGEISITSDMQMTPPIGQKVKRN